MSLVKASIDDVKRVREFFEVVEEYLEFGTVTELDVHGTSCPVGMTPWAFAEILRQKFNGGRFGALIDRLSDAEAALPDTDNEFSGKMSAT